MDRTAIIEQVLERAADYPAGRATYWTDTGPYKPIEHFDPDVALEHG